MSATPHNDTLQPGMFSESALSPASRRSVPSRDPSSSKRVCFYKSGDPQFSGHRVVINSRTFKTFDALLDALSKKVPLPFGVRTITTPKGTHTVRSLDDLRDGASYVCSDQKKVKPLNLEEVNRRQVPWNTTRPTSAGRHGRRGLIRQLMKKNEVRRAAKAVDRFVAVWTPKKLVVYKNRDPSTKRTIVLQRRTAPTFEALLDYLSQVLQFTVVKLYTEDGRRVDGLPALIMCSGIVVAAGNEPFWMGNYNLQGSSQLTQSDVSESIEPANTQALPTKKKTPSSRSRSRNFSLSSEKYFVEQINKSLNGSLMSGDDGQKTGSMDTDNNQSPESEGVGASDCVADIKEKGHFTMPSEDDIEKSFCVNQDGSMTVEMKVRLTIKHEEMIHWTTTLSRTCTDSQQRAVCSQTGSNCPENNHYLAKEAKSDNCESSEENTSAKKSVGINKAGGDHCGSATSEALDKPKPALRRLPTPGPRRVRRKEASVENIKMVSQHEVQESTVGTYSYMERTADGELTEGYCVVSRSSSSSTRPVPKPRKSSSGEAKHKKTSSSVRSSRTAEVLQLQNNGTQITETVMHIYESQGMCENYFANTQVSAEKSLEFRASAREARKPDSSDSGPRSSSNDCDVDITRQSTSSDSQNAKMKNELLSLSSDQSSPSQKINNNLNSRTNSERRTRSRSSHKGLEAHEACTKDNPEVKSPESRKAGITPKSVKSKEGTSSDTSVSDKKQKGGSVPGSLKDLRKSKSPGSQSHTGSEKKTVSSAESEKMGQKVKKKMKEKQLPRSNLGSQNGSSETPQNLDNAGSQKSLKNVNKYDSVTTRDSLKSPIKKKHLEVLQPSHLAPARMLTKPKSMHECRRKSSEKSKEFTESSSMPVLCSSPTNVHQYVENWLKKIQPESLPYLDEMDPPEAETEAKPKFWIGSGSAESSEIRSEPEQDSVVKDCASLEDATTETPVPHTPVQIRCEGDPVEAQRIRGFCKSMPSVRIHPAEQETQIRMNKSSQALVNIQPDAEGETSESSKVSVRSGVKPVLQQLCLSIQSIRRTSSHSNITTLDKEKSSSLPDFSSQVSSVFGAPSKALLSFLSLMTLKDGISSPGNEDRRSNSGSYPEALQVMQSLEKISNIDDEEELKASLTSLQSSTSSKLKKSWRDFQERNDTEGSPPLSPKFSEQEFALEVDSEGEDHDKEHNFGIQELMDELDMSEDLRKEISSLVDGEQTSSDQEKTAKKHYNNENTDVVSENEDATTKYDFLEGEAACSEEKASQDDITGVKEDAEELHRVESCPPEAADPSNDLVKEESEVVEDVQAAENETFQTDPLIDELNMEDNVPTTEEKDTEAITCQDNEPIQNNSEEEKKEEENEEDAELLAYTSVTEGADEVVSEHHSEVNIGEDCETEKNEDESVDGDIRKTDLDEKSMNAAMSEAEHSEHSNREECEMDENQEAKHQTSNFVPEGDSLLNEEVNMSNDEEQNNDMLKSEDAETQHQEPSPVNGISVCESHNSNEVGNEKLTLESPSNEHNHDVTIGEETENTTDLHDALECSADDTDQDIDHNSPLEDEPDRDNEDIISKASECEADNAESHHSSISGQEGGHSDKNEKGSYKSQESESEQNDFRTFEEERDIEKQVSSAEEKCVESDEHEDEQTNALGSENDADSELESNNPALSDMEGEHPDQKERSCKSQESEVEHNPQMSEEERFSEKLTSSPREKGEVEAQHCNALDSEEDNGDQSDQDQPQSCRSKESEVDHDLQASEEGNVTEENEEDIEEHEDKLSIALDSNKDFDAEPEASDSAMSDQDGEQSDQDKEQTCKSQESVDHGLQTPAEGSVEEVHKPENEMCNVSDSDKYFDVQTEEKDSVISDEDGEQSEQDKAPSCKSKESEVDRDFQTPEEDNVTEGNEEEIDEPKNEQCTVSGTDKECNAQTEEKDSVMSDEDGEQSEQDKAQSCKSQESEVDHEHQTLEEGNVSEENEDIDVDEDKNAEDFDVEAEVNDSEVSDQDREQYDQDKPRSCKSQESEIEHESPRVEQGNEEVEEHEDKTSNVSTSDKDFEAEPEVKSPAMSDQDGEPSDPHQSEIECGLQELKMSNFSEENVEEIGEAEVKECNALDSLDSDQDFEAGLDAMSDQVGDYSDQDKARSCKSYESSGDADIEPDYPAVSDQVAELSDQDKTRQESLKSQESGGELRPPSKVQETITKTTSDEEKDVDDDDDDYADEHVDKQDNALDSDKSIDAQSNYSYSPDPKIKHIVQREPYKCQGRETLIAQSDYFEGVREADVGHGFYGVPPMEISQELLDFVNLALLSSALTFTYDSNGQMRIEPDNCKITDICDNQYVQRCLPSPNMSDLSDYRPETSESAGNRSQVSSDLYTETGDEEVEKLSTFQGSVRQSSRNVKRRDKTLDNGLTKNSSGTHTKQVASPSLNSTNSFASIHNTMANGTMQEPAYSNTSGSLNEDSECVQRVVFHSGGDTSEGILIDKGRWLLKENHLIRKSPPVPMGMYENADTTSVDTGQENTSEDAHYPLCRIHHSPMAVISSSELEEMAKPPTPKCTYFNMPHSSDSDPFQESQSVNSSRAGDFRKSRELKVCPMGETSKTLAKKNGSLPSFASVEFKLPDGKVHPEGGLPPSVVENTARSQSLSSRAAQEVESVEELNLRCGRHCPIL